MRERGILAVVSGFSGAGKGTLMEALMAKYDNYALSISATTRQPRDNEEHGKQYFFVSETEFDNMVENDQFIEYARYVEHSYGTPKEYVMEQLEAGKDVILEIEIQGALKVKEKFPETLLIFVTPPSAEELKRRLIGRGTETMDVVEARLQRACQEAGQMDRYDYLLINDQVEPCMEELHRLIQSQHRRMSLHGEFAAKMKKELKEISE